MSERLPVWRAFGDRCVRTARGAPGHIAMEERTPTPSASTGPCWEDAGAAPEDACDALFVDVRVASGRRRLLATAEPLTLTRHAAATARFGLAALAAAFETAADAPLAEALDRAFVAANLAVLRHDRRSAHVGATAVAIAGREMVLAQIPPGQALVLQERRLHAFPDLCSWDDQFVPEPDDPNPAPLGCLSAPHPVLVATTLAPGDVVILTSSAIGRCLARCDDDGFLGCDVAVVPARLAELAAAFDLDNAFAACVLIDGAVTDVAPAVARSTPVEENDPTALGPEATVRRPMRRQQPRAGRMVDAGGYWSQPHPRGVMLLDRIHDALIDSFERLVPAGRPLSLPLDARGRALRPPGAGTVRCYKGGSRFELAPSVRSRLPRGPRIPLSSWATATVLTLALVLGLVYAGYDRYQAHASRVESFLAAADAHVKAVAQVGDPAVVDAELSRAEEALAGAAQHGAPVSLLRSRRQAVADARDHARGIVRFVKVSKLGTLPPGIERSALHLVRAGGELYLIAGAVFQVDGRAHALTVLLAPGRVVAGRPVGALRDVAVDGGVLTVSDGERLYRYESGGWTSQRLGSVRGDGGGTITACSAFQGSFYQLEGDVGQILKFPVGHTASRPQAWVAANAQSNLKHARDMVVDGSIYVLAGDGRIHALFRGETRATLAPAVTPPLANSIALDGGPDTNFLYLAETNGVEGRLIRFDRTGGAVRQYLLPAAGTVGSEVGANESLAQLRDFAVDETAGVISFVSDDAVWSASFPDVTVASRS